MSIRLVLVFIIFCVCSMQAKSTCKPELFEIEGLILFSNFDNSVRALLEQGYLFESKKKQFYCYRKENQKICLEKSNNKYKRLVSIELELNYEFNSSGFSKLYLAESLKRVEHQKHLGKPLLLRKESDEYILCKSTKPVTESDRDMSFMLEKEMFWLDIILLKITYDVNGEAVKFNLGRQLHN